MERLRQGGAAGSGGYQELRRFRLPPKFRGRSAALVQLWWLVQALLFHPSPQFLYRWRVMLLRLFGARIGRRVLIRPSVRVTYPWNLEIGDDAWIGDNVVLYTLATIRIGDNAVVSQRSYLCAGAHDYRQRSFPIYGLPIVVGPEAWLAADVFVAPGISIGRGAVVGVRSTVLSDLPEAMLCYGTPAMPIRPRLADAEAAAGAGHAGAGPPNPMRL